MSVFSAIPNIAHSSTLAADNDSQSTIKEKKVCLRMVCR